MASLLSTLPQSTANIISQLLALVGLLPTSAAIIHHSAANIDQPAASILGGENFLPYSS
jgi:hypothetical protein